MKTQLPLVVLILVLGAAGGWAIQHIEPPSTHEAHDHDHAEPETEAAEGPHGGRLLRADDFAVEVTIFEEDVPPEFRVFAYRAGQPLPPADVQLSIELRRLGGRVDRFAFVPSGDFLRSDGAVREPHSFDVVVRATHAGRFAEWTYAAYEGRAEIAPEFARAAGFVIAQAGPATIRETVTLHGIVRADANRVAAVGARFPGLVKEVRKALGDAVAAGEVLAVIESNDSLQAYEVKSPLAGVVTARAAVAGGVAHDEPLFVVSDFSSVWIELNAFVADAAKLSAGLPVTIRTADGALTAEAKLPPLLPFASAESQTRLIRLRLDNPDGRWAPGLRVIAIVELPPHHAPLAVSTAALQSFRDHTVVFAQVGDTYEVRLLELGRRDRDHVEVLDGLEPRESYVAAHSFLAKAEALKSGAAHDH